MATEKRTDFKTYIPQTAEQIIESITQNIEYYIIGFNNTFNLALQSYQNQQEENLKTDLQYVYICFLRSSITQGLPLFRINLYNEAKIEDLEECYVDWGVEFSKQLYTRLPKVMETLTADKEYNLLVEKYWIEETELFFDVFKILVPKIIRASRQELSRDVQWYYGEYFDQCRLIPWE